MRVEKRYNKARAWAAYVYHRLGAMDAIDHRERVGTERYNSLLNVPCDVPRVVFNHYVEKHELKNCSVARLYELQKELNVFETLNGDFRYHPVFECCCASCHTGTSATPHELYDTQRAKYSGTYICKRCEEVVENIATLKFDIFDRTGFYTNAGITSGKDRGFGGRVFLLKYAEKVDVTNNLYQDMAMHPLLVERIKTRINCEIIRCDKLEKAKELAGERYSQIEKKVERLQEIGYIR